MQQEIERERESRELAAYVRVAGALLAVDLAGGLARSRAPQRSSNRTNGGVCGGSGRARRVRSRKAERGMPLVAFSLIPSVSSDGVHTRPHRGGRSPYPVSRPVAPDDEAPGSRQFGDAQTLIQLRGLPGLGSASGYSLRSMDTGASISIGRTWIRHFLKKKLRYTWICFAGF